MTPNFNDPIKHTYKSGNSVFRICKYAINVVYISILSRAVEIRFTKEYFLFINMSYQILLCFAKCFSCCERTFSLRPVVDA